MMNNNSRNDKSRGTHPGSVERISRSHAPDGPDCSRSRRRQSTSGEIPEVFTVAVYPANRGKVMSTLVVFHGDCRQYHLHRTPHLSPDGHIRRATCGRGRYRIVPAEVRIPKPRRPKSEPVLPLGIGAA